MSNSFYMMSWRCRNWRICSSVPAVMLDIAQHTYFIMRFLGLSSKMNA